MKFLVQSVCQRRLHSMVFLFCILEKLDVGFLILRVGFHGSVIKDAGEYAAVIHLLIIRLRSLLDIFIFLHAVVQILYDDAVGIRGARFLIDPLDDFLKRTEFFLLGSSFSGWSASRSPSSSSVRLLLGRFGTADSIPT